MPPGRLAAGLALYFIENVLLGPVLPKSIMVDAPGRILINLLLDVPPVLFSVTINCNKLDTGILGAGYLLPLYSKLLDVL